MDPFTRICVLLVRPCCQHPCTSQRGALLVCAALGARSLSDAVFERGRTMVRQAGAPSDPNHLVRPESALTVILVAHYAHHSCCYNRDAEDLDEE